MFGAPLIIIITYMKADILKPSRQTILREAKDYVMIAVGMILYGIGWTVFLLPNDITTGGVPGIVSILIPPYCIYCILGNGIPGTVYIFQH